MTQFPQCMDCINYLGKKENGNHFCKAFPESIPAEIFWNRISHKTEVEGDNGIKFEPVDGMIQSAE